MCCAGIFAIVLKKYSAMMCEPEPTPAEPKLIGLPDLTSWSSVRAVLSGLTISDSGLDATIATVAKSFALDGFCSRNVSLIASAVVVTSSV